MHSGVSQMGAERRAEGSWDQLQRLERLLSDVWTDGFTSLQCAWGLKTAFVHPQMIRILCERRYRAWFKAHVEPHESSRCAVIGLEIRVDRQSRVDVIQGAYSLLVDPESKTPRAEKATAVP